VRIDEDMSRMEYKLRVFASEKHSYNFKEELVAEVLESNGQASMDRLLHGRGADLSACPEHNLVTTTSF
jgi:hypothetical protein